MRIDSTIVRAQPHVAGAKKGSKTKHEDGLVAAFLPRSMGLVMRLAPLFDSFYGRRTSYYRQALALLDGMEALRLSWPTRAMTRMMS